MDHVFSIKWISLVFPLILALGGCSESGSDNSSGGITGRNVEIPDSNKQQEPMPGETSTLVLSFQSPVSGSVTYQSFNITAAEKSDYTPVMGSIDVIEGETYSISVVVSGDDEIEGDEQFGIRIVDEFDVEVLVIIAQINNDDFPSVNVTSPVIKEGDEGVSMLTFQLELNDPVVDPYKLHVFTETCENWVDSSDEIRYASPCNDFEPIDTYVTFDSGVQSISFDVVVINDDLLEKDEFVNVSVKYNVSVNESEINVLASQEFAVGTIRTDEEPDRNGFELSMEVKLGESLDEDGPVGSDKAWSPVVYTVKVSNSNSSDTSDGIKQTQSVEVNLQGVDSEGLIDGELFYRAQYSSSALGSDFCINDPTVSEGGDTCLQLMSFDLEPGTEEFEFTVYVLADLVSEPDENIEIILQNDQGIFFSRHFHQIQNDDDPELILLLPNPEDPQNPIRTPLKDFVKINQDGEFNHLLVSENIEGGSFDVDFELANKLAYPWSFSYTFNRPSNSGSVRDASASDYARKSGIINFLAGEVEPVENLSVIITNDDDYEGTELFGLNFVDINVASLLINIIDDEFPVLVLEGAETDGYTIAPEPLDVALKDSEIYTYAMNLNHGVNNEKSTDALSDLNIFYRIIGAASPAADGDTCGYLASERWDGEANSDDFSLYMYQEGESRKQIGEGESVIFSEGLGELIVELGVNKDGIECDEYLALEFTLVNDGVDANSDIDPDRSHSIVRNFKIANENKATLKVYGWTEDEGNSNSGSILINNEKFVMKLDSAVVTDIEYVVTGDGFSCNNEDISGLTSGTTIEFNGNETEVNIEIGVSQDNIVEPDEVCNLFIVNHASEIVNVEYCNGVAPCTEIDPALPTASAQGVIVSDDKLEIIVSAAENVTEPADEGDAFVYPVTITWDKAIAQNVGDIKLNLNKVLCDEGVPCTQGDGDNSDITLTNLFTIKNGAVDEFVETPATALNWQLTVNPDDVVENLEQLKLTLTKKSGQEYIESINETLLNEIDFDISVTSQDTLILSLEEQASDNPCNANESLTGLEQECERVFKIGFSKDVSDQIDGLSVTLALNSNNTSTVKDNVSPYVDAIVSINSIKSDEGEYIPALPIMNEIKLLLVDGGVPQNPFIKVNFYDDKVVEVDEVFSLTLSGGSGADNTITQIVKNEDQLVLTLTEPLAPLEELNESALLPPQTPFTYTWDKEIADNVPSIQFSISSVCSGLESNCAELDLTDTSDFNIQTSPIQFHTQKIDGEGVTGIGKFSLPVSYVIDERVEEDEYINIMVDMVGSELNPTNEDGRSYISGFNKQALDEVVNTLNLESVIKNDDAVALSFIKISQDTDIQGDDETGFLSYKIDWENVTVDDDVALSLDLTFPIPSGSTAIRNPNVNKSVFDYTLQVGSDKGALVTGDEWLLKQEGVSWNPAGSSILYVQLHDDELVELSENINIQLSIPSGSQQLVIKDAGSDETLLGEIDYTIPVADKVQLSIVKNIGNGTTSIEDSKKENTYTVKWNKDIASSVPDLTFNLLVSADTDTESDDFTLDLPEGFINGDNILDKTKGSFVFTTTVNDDIAVELDESFTTTLSIPANSDNSTYLTPLSLDLTLSSFTHVITDTDKIKLSLAVDKVSGDESNESINYTINWTGEAEANVPALTFELGIAGDVTFEKDNSSNDYTIDSKPFNQTLEGAYVLKAEGTALPIDSSNDTLTLQVQHDETVEIDEALTVSLSIQPEDDLLELGTSEATYKIINNDFLTLTINGLLEQPEPTSSDRLAYTLSWDKLIELPSGLIPSVSLTSNNCTGSQSLQCLDASDYTLTTPTPTLTLAPPNQITDLPLTLKPDFLVELKEKIALQLTGSPGFIEKVVFSETSEAFRTVTVPKGSEANWDMNWDLTVISDDRLALSMGTAITELTECSSNIANCPDAQTVNTLTVAGTVAENGPTITLQTNVFCDDTVDNATFVCAKSSGDTNGGIDYILEAGNADIVLHNYNVDSIDDLKSKTIKISPQKDNWVEVDEIIKLKIAPNSASEDYVSLNWTHNQDITLTSEDVVGVSLVRDLTQGTDENGLCTFNSGSTTHIDEATCTSQYNVLLTKSIASQVPSISVILTASADSELKIKAAGENLSEHKFDAIAQYGTDDVYSTINVTPAVFTLPIHGNGSSTVPADAQAFKLIYQEDARIEIDDSIQLILSEGTGDQYTLPTLGNGEFTINETLKNDDFLVLTISGSNTHDELDTSATPYVLSWNGEIDESVTISFNDTRGCTETADKKCLSAGNDYTLGGSSIPLIDVDTTDSEYKRPLDLTLLPKDGLVEFPEIVNLQLVVDSALISGVEHDNADADTNFEKNGDVSTLNWTLTVNNTDKLTLELTAPPVLSVNESCPAKNDQLECVQVASVGSIEVTGAIASNGPAMNLTTSDICDTANTDANSDLCAILDGKKDGADDSEKDYTINTTTATIALKGLKTGDLVPIELTLNDDTWVEVQEIIKLNIAPNDASKTYIEGANWSVSPTINLINNDVAGVDVTGPSTTCAFETGTTTFKEEVCTSTYAFTLDKSIAKEVPTTLVELTKDASTNAEIKLATDDALPFDVVLKLDTAEQYFTANALSLPIHTAETATSPFTTPVTVTYNDDTRVEVPESIMLTLANLTSATSSLFTIPTGTDALVINETILNNDILKLGVTISSASGQESDTEYDYFYNWDKAVDSDVGNLTFQLEFDASDNAATQETDTPREGDDYVIAYSGVASAQRFSLIGNVLTLNMDADLPESSQENYVLTIKEDDLVELDETIAATLSLVPNDSGNTPKVAIVDSTNNAISHTIENDDTLNVTLYTTNDVEGTNAGGAAFQPFSYTIDKDIAANVPAIELAMSLNCTDSDILNCVEFEAANSDNKNDISFGDVNQLIEVHGAGNPTTKHINDEKTPVPITVILDSRVEAHESLVINFDKENDLTNEDGRKYIGNILDNAVQPPLVPVVPVNDLSITAEIQNDDKLNLFITQTDDTCVLTDESSQACDFEISWFNPGFDMTPVENSVATTNTAKGELTVLISVAEAAGETATSTAANTPAFWGFDRWDVETKRTDANDALAKAQLAETFAKTAIDNAGIAENDAKAVLDSAQEAGSIDAATSAKNAAVAASSAAIAAKGAATAAIEAANAALEALTAAVRAQNSNGNREAAKDAADAATTAASNATTKANEVIEIANSTTALAQAAISEALQVAIAPVIDNDAGEISLAMALTGTATNIATPISADDDTDKDPQDYSINLEDEKDGAVTEQVSAKIILKNTDSPMAALPRTLTLAVNNDLFMEPAESFALNFAAIEAADNHKLITAFPGLAFTAEIAANDVASITVTSPTDGGTAITSGNEGTNVVLAYEIELSNPVAANSPNITLMVNPVDPDGDGLIEGVMGAVSTSDYLVANVTIHDQSKGETLSFEESLDLTINADNTLELTELLKVNLAVTGGSLDGSGINLIEYTIQNDDVLTIDVTSATDSDDESVASNAITYTLSGENIASDSTEILVAENYPDILLSHAVSGTATDNGTDFTAPANFNVHTKGTAQNNGVSFNRNLLITNDPIVEKDESIVLTLSDNAPVATDVVFTVNTANTNTLTYNILNDDVINIAYWCGDAVCDGALSETGDKTDLRVVVAADYTSQGLTEAADHQLSLTLTPPTNPPAGNATVINDFNISTVKLLSSGSAGDVVGAILTVVDDKDIEKTEDFSVTIPNNIYVTAAGVTTDFTITNNDTLMVNPVTTQLDGIASDQPYNLQVCKPEVAAIEGGDLELAITLKEVIVPAAQTVASLSCADIDLSLATANCTDSLTGSIADIGITLNTGVLDVIPVCSGTPSSTYTSIELFTLKGQSSIKANEWFNVAVASDERCASPMCSAATDVVVLTTQLSNVLDTGLTQCLKSGLNERWSVDCDTVKNNSDYLFQDAAQTHASNSNNIYPDLAYTYVSSAGLPVAAKPDSGEVCVQDNNTGFIWSGTILDSVNVDKNIRIYSDFGDITERDNYDCDLSGSATWQLPTVQDLMTIIDVEKLKTSRELSIRFTNSSQFDVNEDEVEFKSGFGGDHSASYWTSDTCDSDDDIDTIEVFTLDFLSGELLCSGTTAADKNSIMMLYK